MANIDSRARGAVQALALSAVLASTATLASVVTVRYDLDDGALLVAAGGGNVDWFRSGRCGIGSQTFSPTVPNTFCPLQLDIQFWTRRPICRRRCRWRHSDSAVRGTRPPGSAA